MNNKPKKVNTAIIVILYLLAALFLGYGIYMAYDAVTYVQTYDTEGAVSTANIVQYVVGESVVYFGFAIVIFAAAFLLGALNKVRLNLYHSLTAPHTEDVQPEELLVDDGEQMALELDNNDVYSENAPEADAGPAADAETETEPAPAAALEPELPAEPAPAVEPELPAEPEDAADSAPAAALEAELPTESAPAVEPELPAEPKAAAEPTLPAQPEIIPQEVPHPESADALPEIVQPEPTDALPEIVQPEPELTQAPPDDNILETLDAMEPVSAAQQSPPNDVNHQIPETILQSKRKRGLKYETVAMEEPEPVVQNVSSDTIRLSKDETEAISSSFIRGIFEKNQ